MAMAEAGALLSPAEVTQMFRVDRASPTFAERVFAKVDASGDCWQWTGALNKGYGVIGRGGRGSGTIEAHRAVWELLVGPVDDDLQLDHLCRNRACCNPDHLEPVTQAENIRRGYAISTMHARRSRCNFGHPLDGVLGTRGGQNTSRYCKTCARQKAAARKALTIRSAA